MTSKRIKSLGIAECEEVRSSTSLVQRDERHENQMKGCAAEPKIHDWQMIVWTSWSCDTVKGRRGMADDRYVML